MSDITVAQLKKYLEDKPDDMLVVTGDQRSAYVHTITANVVTARRTGKIAETYVLDNNANTKVLVLSAK